MVPLCYCSRFNLYLRIIAARCIRIFATKVCEYYLFENVGMFLEYLKLRPSRVKCLD